MVLPLEYLKAEMLDLMMVYRVVVQKELSLVAESVARKEVWKVDPTASMMAQKAVVLMELQLESYSAACSDRC